MADKVCTNPEKKVTTPIASDPKRRKLNTANAFAGTEGKGKEGGGGARPVPARPRIAQAVDPGRDAAPAAPAAPAAAADEKDLVMEYEKTDNSAQMEVDRRVIEAFSGSSPQQCRDFIQDFARQRDFSVVVRFIYQKGLTGSGVGGGSGGGSDDLKASASATATGLSPVEGEKEGEGADKGKKDEGLAAAVPLPPAPPAVVQYVSAACKRGVISGGKRSKGYGTLERQARRTRNRTSNRCGCAWKVCFRRTQLRDHQPVYSVISMTLEHTNGCNPSSHKPRKRERCSEWSVTDWRDELLAAWCACEQKVLHSPDLRARVLDLFARLGDSKAAVGAAEKEIAALMSET
eukprot:CAMPEP_0177681770 /NCGR_PEP_ID=MMETSP0447-20121125/30901_1 /TAXON_ID=0 /ORGANISM="Stygamoeba regulata, Strain BSH-02190019" /LENGTH=346 /DNA_ID=CAMNT_0019191225 /DNA_START=176 /DNA_END=1211 /DNA_ORIENTATION=+